MLFRHVLKTVNHTSVRLQNTYPKTTLLMAAGLYAAGYKQCVNLAVSNARQHPDVSKAYWEAVRNSPTLD